MIRSAVFLFVSFFLVASRGSSQNGPMLVGSGYGLPKYLTVAPGQILTIHVTGLKAVLTAPLKVTTTPLPKTLSGISVTINQYGLYVVQSVSLSVPIMGISQRNYCTDSLLPGCLLTFITVQIPFELVFFQNPTTGPPQCPVNVGGTCPQTELNISENGVSSKGFAVMPVGDNIHIITDCDAKAFGSADFAVPSEYGISSGTYQTCQAKVTHADGKLISYESPANPGEVVVLYAWGVGPTKPLVKTGDVTPAPSSATWANDVQFSFSPNAPPSKPYGGIFPFTFEFHPRFVGLVQGEIGLYQINVKLPDTFPHVQQCDPSRDGVYSIQSNLTITVGGLNSFDGAGICVQPTP